MNKKCYALLIVGIGLLELVIVEVWFYYVNAAAMAAVHYDIRINGKYASSLYVPDPVEGVAEPPDSSITHSLWVDGKKIFVCTYLTDSYSRRIVPIKSDPKRNKFALFFVCSYVWGWGVDAEQTLPFYFAKYAKDYVPYNYACPSYGPQNMLALLQSRDIRKEITQKDGIVIFIFMFDHINRLTASLNALARDYNLPYYVLNGRSELINKGIFQQQPAVKYFYSWFCRLQTVRRLFGTPPYITDHTNNYEIQLFSKVIMESRDLCRKKLNCDKFYVIFVNGTETKIRKNLSNNGIENHFEIEEGKDLFFPIPDGHPKAKYNDQLAQDIAKDIGVYTGN